MKTLIIAVLFICGLSAQAADLDCSEKTLKDVEFAFCSFAQKIPTLRK